MVLLYYYYVVWIFLSFFFFYLATEALNVIHVWLAEERLFFIYLV